MVNHDRGCIKKERGLNGRRLICAQRLYAAVLQPPGGFRTECEKIARHLIRAPVPDPCKVWASWVLSKDKIR